MPHLSKRDRLAKAALQLGVTQLLEASPKRRSLTVLTYHRIGNHDLTNYDPAVYSATATDFDDQVSYLRRFHHVLSLEESIDFLRYRDSRVRSGVLITFDDGYVDNYQTAFPILRSHGVPATFFLCTSYIGTATIPWWDQIAYLIRKTKNTAIRFDYPDVHQLDLSAGREVALRKILKVFKSPQTTDPNRMIAALEDACEVSSPVGAERLFLNWEEASEMLEGGMSIGSHTHTHCVLAKLPYEVQVQELRTSRTILEERLRTKIASLAYPVGGPAAFSASTMSAASDAGYQIAFSNYGGFNYLRRVNRFDIRRNSIDHGTTLCRFRLQCALGAVTGAQYF